jgi:hypothetical protein
MNLFSYIVKSDSGLAPNPFWGCCTLACCKPAIRRVADIGDLVVGLTPKARGHKIVYIMRITDKLTFEDYWNHQGFRRKRPHINGKNKVRCGDNFYRPLPGGCFQQLRSQHSNTDGSENKKCKMKDLSGKFVLVSDDFVYFGSDAKSLPRQFQRLIVGRGHRRLSSEDYKHLVQAIEKFFARQRPRGRQGTPLRWAEKPSKVKRKPCQQ